jgi:hypothetical protein
VSTASKRPKFPAFFNFEYDDEFADRPLGSMWTLFGFCLGAGVMLAGAILTYWYIEKQRR